MSLRSFLFVALGGAAGSVLRYAAALLLPRAAPHSFPWATCGVNLCGSLLIGFLAGFATRCPGWMSSTGWPLLAVGLCGGFTTFSAFSLDTMQLFRQGAQPTAMAYILGSVAAGILLCYVGYYIAAQQV